MNSLKKNPNKNKKKETTHPPLPLTVYEDSNHEQNSSSLSLPNNTNNDVSKADDDESSLDFSILDALAEDDYSMQEEEDLTLKLGGGAGNGNGGVRNSQQELDLEQSEGKKSTTLNIWESILESWPSSNWNSNESVSRSAKRKRHDSDSNVSTTLSLESTSLTHQNGGLPSSSSSSSTGSSSSSINPSSGGGTSGSSNSSTTATEGLSKREIFMLKNRQAAQRSRLKKKMQIQSMEVEYKSLKSRNYKLIAEVNRLTIENNVLKEQNDFLRTLTLNQAPIPQITTSKMTTSKTNLKEQLFSLFESSQGQGSVFGGHEPNANILPLNHNDRGTRNSSVVSSSLGGMTSTTTNNNNHHNDHDNDNDNSEFLMHLISNATTSSNTNPYNNLQGGAGEEEQQEEESPFSLNSRQLQHQDSFMESIRANFASNALPTNTNFASSFTNLSGTALLGVAMLFSLSSVHQIFHPYAVSTDVSFGGIHAAGSSIYSSSSEYENHHHHASSHHGKIPPHNNGIKGEAKGRVVDLPTTVTITAINQQSNVNVENTENTNNVDMDANMADQNQTQNQNQKEHSHSHSTSHSTSSPGQLHQRRKGNSLLAYILTKFFLPLVSIFFICGFISIACHYNPNSRTWVYYVMYQIDQFLKKVDISLVNGLQSSTRIFKNTKDRSIGFISTIVNKIKWGKTAQADAGGGGLVGGGYNNRKTKLG